MLFVSSTPAKEKLTVFSSKSEEIDSLNKLLEVIPDLLQQEESVEVVPVDKNVVEVQCVQEGVAVSQGDLNDFTTLLFSSNVSEGNNSTQENFNVDDFIPQDVCFELGDGNVDDVSVKVNSRPQLYLNLVRKKYVDFSNSVSPYLKEILCRPVRNTEFALKLFEGQAQMFPVARSAWTCLPILENLRQALDALEDDLHECVLLPNEKIINISNEYEEGKSLDNVTSLRIRNALKRKRSDLLEDKRKKTLKECVVQNLKPAKSYCHAQWPCKSVDRQYKFLQDYWEAFFLMRQDKFLNLTPYNDVQTIEQFKQLLMSLNQKDRELYNLLLTFLRQWGIPRIKWYKSYLENKVDENAFNFFVENQNEKILPVNEKLTRRN